MTANEKIGNAFCLLIALCALAAAGWAMLSARAFDLDGLFLIMVALLFALLFSWMPVQAARRAGLFRKFARRKAAQPADEESKAAPSAQSTGENAKLTQTAQQKT